jgi:DNA-binding HxlR family transcriptional regulator
MDTWCLEATATRLGVVTETSTTTDSTSMTDRFTIAAPHRELLDQVLDRWSLHVLDELCERPARFSELRRLVPAVTQKSLTATLRRLERNGVVERVVLSTRPIAVQYRITPLGKTLRAPVETILAWADEHLPAIEAARRRYDDDEN